MYLVLVMVITGTMSFKTERTKTATLVRDCTGTYLRYQEKDYHVCNADILSDYHDGDKMIIRFRKIKKCTQQEGQIVCMMFHENEGWIKVKKVLNEKR